MGKVLVKLFQKLAESRGGCLWSLSADSETLKGCGDEVPALLY